MSVKNGQLIQILHQYIREHYNQETVYMDTENCLRKCNDICFCFTFVDLIVWFYTTAMLIQHRKTSPENRADLF
mgnify:CR=1 FL=1